MKNIINSLLLVVCLCMAIPAQAQLKWGVKGGLNLSQVSLDRYDTYSGSVVDPSYGVGFFLGPMLDYTFPNTGWGVDASALYTQKKFKFEGAWETGMQEGFEVPVNLKYTFELSGTVGLFLAAGPDFYFDISNLDHLQVSKDEFCANKRNVSQMGINVGAGVKLLRHLQLGVNYTIPVSEAGDTGSYVDVYTPVSGYGKYKLKTWQLSVAYLF